MLWIARLFDLPRGSTSKALLVSATRDKLHDDGGRGQHKPWTSMCEGLAVNGPPQSHARARVAKATIQSTAGYQRERPVRLPLRQTELQDIQTLPWRTGRSTNVQMCDSGSRARENSLQSLRRLPSV